MSKTKAKKKAKQNVKKKKKSNKKLIISLISVAMIIVVVITAAIITNNINSKGIKELCNNSWTAGYAKNASGDEVPMQDVYNSDHTSFKGSLNFFENSTFSLWLSPGNPDDGTHKGTFKLINNNSDIDVTFDDGTQTGFAIERDGDNIKDIIVYYNDYEVYFVNN